MRSKAAGRAGGYQMSMESMLTSAGNTRYASDTHQIRNGYGCGAPDVDREHPHDGREYQIRIGYASDTHQIRNGYGGGAPDVDREHPHDSGEDKHGLLPALHRSRRRRQNAGERRVAALQRHCQCTRYAPAKRNKCGRGMSPGELWRQLHGRDTYRDDGPFPMSARI